MNEEGRLSPLVACLSLSSLVRHRSSAIIWHQRVGCRVCHAHTPTRLKQWALSNLLLLPWQVTGKVRSPRYALFCDFVAGEERRGKTGGSMLSKSIWEKQVEQAEGQRGSCSVCRLFWRSIFELATFCCYFCHCCCYCCCCTVVVAAILLCNVPERCFVSAKCAINKRP